MELDGNPQNPEPLQQCAGPFFLLLFTQEEQEGMLTVSEGNKIPECAGYRLFVLKYGA